jgi:integrase
MPRKRYSVFSRENKKTGAIAWSVALGENQYRQFKIKRDAMRFAEDLKDEEFLNDRDEARQLGTLLKDKYDLLKFQRKLRTWGTTWDEVFKFYETHGSQAQDCRITLDEGMRIVLDSKRKDRYVSEVYLKHLEAFSFKKLREHFGSESLIKNISRKDFEMYLRKSKVSVTSKNHLITTSKTLFNTLVELGHLGLNPIKKISHIPKDRAREFEIFSVSETRKILTQCLKEENYPFLASLILVFYCGVRIGESQKLKWNEIRYKDQSVFVSEIVAKKTKHLHSRMSKIPPNAMCWLRFCYSTAKENKGDPIIQLSSSHYYKSIRKLVKRSQVDKWYKNILRHTFASYGCVYEPWGLSKTAEKMGHYRNIDVLKNNYQHKAYSADSDLYFDLYPNRKYFPEGTDAETLKLVEKDLEERRERSKTKSV